MANSFVNNFEIPTWAGKPPPGLHLDVMKETKMIQKLMIDEKRCYFFGRNKQLCDFCIDHGSCSRVHAALVWHKHLNRPFIIDLGSTHGTFIGTIRLDSKKPQQVPIDSELHFGASTRRYIIRERPQAMTGTAPGEEKMNEDIEGGLLGLPETEMELDNLTEFNTAHNRRIAAIGDLPDSAANPMKRKRRSSHVKFNEEEDIINPEDIDPSVGRFRNLIQTTVVPKKKPRLEGPSHGQSLTDSITKRMQSFPYAPVHSLYDNENIEDQSSFSSGTFTIAAKLGLKMPNLAPEIDSEPQQVQPSLPAVAPVQPSLPPESQEPQNPSEPKKKKYAKEAWPGKKPTHSLFG